MRLFHCLVFDDYVNGTAAMYTAPEFHELLGSAGTMTLAGYTAKGDGTNPTLTVQVEQGFDGERWTNRNGLAEINAAAISTSGETTFQANDGNPVGEKRERLARLRVQLGGTSPKARVRIWATGRTAPKFAMPESIAGLMLWLRGDLGITTVNAAVASANDLSTGSWSASNVGSRNATQFYDNNVNAAHQLLQAVPNLQLNHSAHFRFDVPLVGGLGRYAHIYVNAGAGGVFLDTETGSIMTQTGVSNVSYSGGVLEFDATVSDTQIFFRTSNDGTNDVYLGDGTRFVQLGPGTGGHDAIEVTQRNISVWGDQSGNGNNFSMGTAADRPLFVPNLVAGRPGITHDTTDRLSHASSVSLGTAASIFLVMQRGTASNTYITADSTSAHGLIENFNTNQVEWFVSGGDRQTLSTGATGVHIACITQTNGVNLTGYWDGAQVFSVVPSSALQNLKHLGFGAASNCGGSKAELIVYNRVLETAERKAVEQYLSSRYGITLP